MGAPTEQTGPGPTEIDEILAALRPQPDRLIVRNEFGVVGVSVTTSACGTRLRIEDLRTRQSVELDALELESLAWAHHEDLSPLLDPSASRWAGTDEEANR
jgi:hypothetical protein